MNHTVIWRPQAEQDLAQLWLDSDDRAAVTSAANVIDMLLRHDPESRGESRNMGTRILFVPPLVALFEVVDADRQVFVLRVKGSRRAN